MGESPEVAPRAYHLVLRDLGPAAASPRVSSLRPPFPLPLQLLLREPGPPCPAGPARNLFPSHRGGGPPLPPPGGYRPGGFPVHSRRGEPGIRRSGDLGHPSRAAAPGTAAH